MRSYWTQTRPNGKPVDAGTFAYVIDLEDGTNPQVTYGRTEQEVLDKLAHQNANAQAALARRISVGRTVPNQAATRGPVMVAPRMTADQVQQATADLENPAKSGKAIASLVQDATGLDLNRLVLANFRETAEAWEAEHPEFYSHFGNKRLLTDQAKQYAGGELGRITPQILTQAFNDLSAAGLLFTEPAAPFNSSTPSPLPGESPAQRMERPRRLSTGVRGTTLRTGTVAPQRTLKYSEQDIRSMPLSKSKQLLESRDRDYAEACEFYFSEQQATA